MASVESIHDLAEDGPDELLVGELVLVLEVLDDAAEVAVAAVLHVQVQVLRGLQVLALVVADDVWVYELLEDGQLGLQLFLLLLRHLGVGDLFATQDVAVVPALHLTDDSK